MVYTVNMRPEHPHLLKPATDQHYLDGICGLAVQVFAFIRSRPAPDRRRVVGRGPAGSSARAGCALISAGCLQACTGLGLFESQKAPAPPAAEPRDTAPPAEPGVRFGFPAPGGGDLQAGPHLVWFTNYYTPVYHEQDEGIPLLGADNLPISGEITRQQWCDVALQGSASLLDRSGQATPYVYLDSQGPEQANCDAQLGDLSDRIKRATRRIRFRAVAHPYGCGVADYPLIPFRTVAVDRNTIPYGTVLYVPAFRDQPFTLDEVRYVHDGYVYAADKGGAIQGTHVDFFTGHQQESPFPGVITSSDAYLFEAWPIPAAHAAAVHLSDVHAAGCAAP
jgi:3D (Asp-Asp-Asp) domain-containing protein